MKLDTLEGYPCPSGGICYLGCSNRYECIVLPIYKELIALRRAVLGEMTPAVAREIYSATAGLCEGMALYNAAGRLHALADVVEKMHHASDD